MDHDWHTDNIGWLSALQWPWESPVTSGQTTSSPCPLPDVPCPCPKFLNSLKVLSVANAWAVPTDHSSHSNNMPQQTDFGDWYTYTHAHTHTHIHTRAHNYVDMHTTYTQHTYMRKKASTVNNLFSPNHWSLIVRRNSLQKCQTNYLIVIFLNCNSWNLGAINTFYPELFITIANPLSRWTRSIRHFSFFAIISCQRHAANVILLSAIERLADLWSDDGDTEHISLTHLCHQPVCL